MTIQTILNLDNINDIAAESFPLWREVSFCQAATPWLTLDEAGVLDIEFKPDSSRSFDVYHRRTLRWRLPANMTGYELDQLVEKNIKLLDEVYSGHSVEWDGSNHVGELDDDAQKAFDAFKDICEAAQDTCCEYPSDEDDGEEAEDDSE